MSFLQRNFATGYLILAMSLAIPLSGAQEFSQSSSTTGRMFYRPGEERLIVPGEEPALPVQDPLVEQPMDDVLPPLPTDVPVSGEAVLDVPSVEEPEAPENDTPEPGSEAAPVVEFPENYPEDTTDKPAAPDEEPVNLFVDEPKAETSLIDTIMFYAQMGVIAVVILGGGMMLLLRLRKKKAPVAEDAAPEPTQPQTTPFVTPRLDKAMEELKQENTPQN